MAGVAVFMCLVAVAFAIALSLGHPVVGFVMLIGGLVITFVMAIAYMRPKGHTPEHHGKIDRIVRDTKP